MRLFLMFAYLPASPARSFIPYIPFPYENSTGTSNEGPTNFFEEIVKNRTPSQEKTLMFKI